MGEKFEGGEPARDHALEARVKKLEDDLLIMKTDLAVIRSNYATREDLHKELHATTWKIIGTFAVLCGAVFWIARNVSPPSPAYRPTTSTPAAAQAAPAPVQQHK